MKFARTGVFVVLLMILGTGCSTTPDFKEDEELQSLVKALVRHDADMKKKRAERQNRGIKKLIAKRGRRDFFVSADLDNASIPVVVTRLFNDTGIPYLFDKEALYGHISVRFDNLPFLKALNLILDPVSLNARRQGRVVAIRSRWEGRRSTRSATKYIKVPLRNLDIATASAFLEGLYPEAADEGRTISFGAVPGNNTIYVSGASEEVSRAAYLLRKADQDVPHVVIEVLVVEFSRGELEKLGARIQEFQNGKFSDVNIDYSSNSSDFISFGKFLNEDGEYNDFLTSFKATVNLLISDNKARLISRPYISTLSGMPAQIEIANDRYLIVDKENDVTAADPVTSGVILRITPTVLSDERLRMDVHVEDSQFSTSAEEKVATEVSKNSARTVMQVEDGQTIIIGGLVANRRAWTKSGFPWLRNVPGLNLFFGNRSDELAEKEVSIYVTAHIWKPNMLSPIIEPGAMTIKGEGDVGSFIRKYK